MIVKGTYLNTTQMAALVVRVATQITKRSVGTDGPKNIEFVEVSYQFKELSCHHNQVVI